MSYLDRGHKYELRYRSVTFYTSTYQIKTPTSSSFAPIPIPEDANIGTFADQIIVTLRSAWLGHPQGAMLAAPIDAFMAAGDDEARGATLSVLFAPSDTCSLEASAESRNCNHPRAFQPSKGSSPGLATRSACSLLPAVAAPLLATSRPVL